MAALPAGRGLPDRAAGHHSDRLGRAAATVTGSLPDPDRPGGGHDRRDRRTGGVRMSRTAREVVELYNLVVWNTRDIALAEELLGDSVIRHEVGEAVTLTHAEAVKRVIDHLEMFDEIRFDLNLVVAGD